VHLADRPPGYLVWRMSCAQRHLAAEGTNLRPTGKLR
jgi:hypothetical protein